MRKNFLVALIVLSLLLPGFPRADAVSTSASSVILVDADSGRVLYQKNADEVRLIASITKLMTALVVAEQAPDLSEMVTVRPEWLVSEGSSIYLKAGEKITVEALLYGLLLESGNDAAMVLACSIAGSVEEFAARMNKKAAELGMDNSSFANPSGLNADRHYSTARDMAVLAAACLNNELVAKICATRSITFGTRIFTNHNRLLSLYDGCVGMKTGYTKRAGRTLVSAAKRNGQTLIAVTLNDPDDWKDHMAMFDYGFSVYPAQRICEAGEWVRNVAVGSSLVRFADVAAAEGFSYPLKEGETLRREVVCCDMLAAPVRAGQSVGKVVYYLGETVVGRVDLVCLRSIQRDSLAEATLLQRILSVILGETITVLHRGGLG